MLANDISRCKGQRFGDQEICSEREECLRYLALIQNPELVVSVVDTMRADNSVPCRYKVEP